MKKFYVRSSYVTFYLKQDYSKNSVYGTYNIERAGKFNKEELDVILTDFILYLEGWKLEEVYERKI